MAEFNYNLNGYFKEDFFTGTIGADGTIYSQSMSNGKVAIGVDNKIVQEMQNTINEMQETLDNWKPKMIEHGYITVEKTQEEILQEQNKQQAEINQQLLQAINSLNNQVKELTTNGNDRNVSTEDIKNIGKKSGTNTTSNNTSKKNATK